MRKLGPTTAIELLGCFYKNQLTLSEDMFDECFDAVTDFLERVNNKKHLLTPRGDEAEADGIQEI